ncbi:hypothetical protein N7540_009876 [Penicillium herquei]|nr:hypothetical protein N7540_009876 [Penicillium herquei]
MISPSKMQNPSCLLYGPGDVRFEDQPLPIIEDPYDVIIRIAYTGVSGSDVDFWYNGGTKKPVSEDDPLILGHEASGIVHAIGPAVLNLQPGDPVAIEPGAPCRLCSRCKLGKYNLCPEMSFAGSPPFHGTLTKYYKIPADCCYKIPPSVGISFGLDEAVLIEPLAVAVHSVPSDYSVQLWRSLSSEENAQCLRGFDVAIEATGVDYCIQMAIHSLRVGGSFVQTALGSERNVVFPIATVLENEINVKGCFRYAAGDFKMALELAFTRKIELKPLITKVVDFENVTEAWETVRHGHGIKTLVRGVGYNDDLEDFVSERCGSSTCKYAAQYL